MLWLRAKQLKSKFVKLRQEAAEVLGKSKDPRAVLPLMDAANDDDPLVRLAVYQALTNFGPVAVEELHKTLSDPNPERRWMAVHMLGRIGSKEAVLPIMSVLTDSAALVRLEAAECLGKLQDRRAIKNLICLLKDPDVDVRQAAATALGQIPSPKAVEPLLQLFDEGDMEAKLTVVKALQTPGWETLDARLRSLVAISIKEWLGTLQQQLWDAAIYDINDKVSVQLNSVIEEKAPEGLIEIITSGSPPSRCLLAAEALGKIGSPRAVPALLATCIPEDVALRNAVIVALEQIGAAGFDDLLAGLSHENANVRKTAIVVLRRIGEPGACPALCAAVQDPASGVRAAAIAALGEFPGQQDIIGPLLDALRDSDRNVALAAAHALTRVTDASHYPALAVLPASIEDAELKLAVEKAAEAARLRPVATEGG